MTAPPDPTPDPASDQALEVAARWVTVLRRGQPSARDRRALQAWLQADTANAAALDMMLDVWDRLEPLRPRAAGMALTASRRKPRPVGGAATIWAGIWAPLGGLAAAGLAAAVLIWPPSSQATYATAVGEMKSIALSDHSQIWLNTGSRLKVKLTPFGRQLALEQGEAEFKVAHERFRAFVVSTPTASVRATGTDFSVRTETDGARVVLVQGTVTVRRNDDGRAQAITAGSSLMAPTTGAFQLTQADPQADLAWRRGELVFYERPLGEVAAEFARYTGVKVRFADPSAPRVRISGAFRATDFKSFLRDIAILYHIHSSTDDSRDVVMTRGV
jgi:transmembrane sensor